MPKYTAREFVVTVFSVEGKSRRYRGFAGKREAIREARAKLRRLGERLGSDGNGLPRIDVDLVVGKGNDARPTLLYQAHWSIGGIVVDEL